MLFILDLPSITTNYNRHFHNQQHYTSTNMSSSNEPSQLNGQYNSVKGTVVEAIGNATGSTEWQTSGKQTHAEGEGEQKAAQAKGYVEGATDAIGE